MQLTGPLRINSPHMYDRIIANLNMAYVRSLQEGTHLWVGFCGCTASMQTQIPVVSNLAVEVCPFCGRTIALTKLLQLAIKVGEDHKCKVAIIEDESRSSERTEFTLEVREGYGCGALGARSQSKASFCLASQASNSHSPT